MKETLQAPAPKKNPTVPVEEAKTQSVPVPNEKKVPPKKKGNGAVAKAKKPLPVATIQETKPIYTDSSPFNSFLTQVKSGTQTEQDMFLALTNDRYDQAVRAFADDPSTSNHNVVLEAMEAYANIRNTFEVIASPAPILPLVDVTHHKKVKGKREEDWDI